MLYYTAFYLYVQTYIIQKYAHPTAMAVPSYHSALHLVQQMLNLLRFPISYSVLATDLCKNFATWSYFPAQLPG
jgi:hypothetical protein